MDPAIADIDDRVAAQTARCDSLYEDMEAIRDNLESIDEAYLAINGLSAEINGLAVLKDDLIVNAADIPLPDGTDELGIQTDLVQ